MNQNTLEFKWYATECGPEHYPMEIRQGTFFYKDRNDGLYIPSGATLHDGWGEGVSLHVTGPERKPLPDRVEVYFYSYAENQFYRGKFDLPYERIKHLFQKGFEDDPKKPHYDAIMIGVAPGGAVTVWLDGRRVTEVFFGYAEKINIDVGKGLDVPLVSKSEADEYTNQVLIDSLTEDELENLKKNGIPFGTWARYRNSYNWEPLFKNGEIFPETQIISQFLNGESYRIPALPTDQTENPSRPLPRELSFSVSVDNELIHYTIKFEEFELMEAFEKLGANGEKVYIEFDAQIPVTNLKIRVYNDKQPKDEKTPKEFIELKKFTVEP